MARELELEVANFVCRFGEDKVMGDLLEQVVIPASNKTIAIILLRNNHPLDDARLHSAAITN